MRADYALFQRDGEFVHNILPTRTLRRAQNHFLYLEILGFLHRVPKNAQNDVTASYLFSEDITSQFVSMGYEQGDLDEALQYLSSIGLLAREVGSKNGPDRTSFALTPAGLLHIRIMPQFVEYISSISLWARCTSVALQKEIAQFWGRPEGRRDLSFHDKAAVAKRFVDYLFEQKARADRENPFFAAQAVETDFVLELMKNAVEQDGPRRTPAKAKRPANRRRATAKR
jgi:hypothetical protein